MFFDEIAYKTIEKYMENDAEDCVFVLDRKHIQRESQMKNLRRDFERIFLNGEAIPHTNFNAKDTDFMAEILRILIFKDDSTETGVFYRTLLGEIPHLYNLDHLVSYILERIEVKVSGPEEFHELFPYFDELLQYSLQMLDHLITSSLRDLKTNFSFSSNDVPSNFELIFHRPFKKVNYNTQIKFYVDLKKFIEKFFVDHSLIHFSKDLPLPGTPFSYPVKDK